MGWVSKSDMTGGGGEFLSSLRIVQFGVGSLSFSETVDSVVVVFCEIVGVGLLDFDIMVLELDSSHGGCFCLELGV